MTWREQWQITGTEDYENKNLSHSETNLLESCALLSLYHGVPIAHQSAKQNQVQRSSRNPSTGPRFPDKQKGHQRRKQK